MVQAKPVIGIMARNLNRASRGFQKAVFFRDPVIEGRSRSMQCWIIYLEQQSTRGRDLCNRSGDERKQYQRKRYVSMVPDRRRRRKAKSSMQKAGLMDDVMQ